MNKTGNGCFQKGRNFIDMANQEFGRLTVVKNAGANSKGEYFWECQCSCGNTIIVRGSNLRNKKTASCGCLTRDRMLTHGHSNTRLYGIWGGMKSRCYNKNVVAFANYGGRGIVVCDEWKEDFKAFYGWAMANGYSEELSIDRINPNGNYEPSNCRWATSQCQAINRRSSHKIKYNNKTYCISELSRLFNIPRETLRRKLKNSCDVEKILANQSDCKVNGGLI